MNADLELLYQQALPTFRSGVFYNTYAYPTKIAPESIAVYIATHTQPGDTVLDMYAGSGSTGLAALMCEHPTNDMLRIANQLGVAPKWGPRNAILYDISTYGSFAARVMTNPPDADEFVRAVQSILRKCENGIGQCYRSVNPSGEEGVIRHVVWSNVLICPNCGEEFTFFEGMVEWEPVRIGPNGQCPHCGSSIKASECAYATESYYDELLHDNVVRRKRVPAFLYGETNGKKWKRPATDFDFRQIAKVEDEPYPTSIEPRPIRWGELHRAGYHLGITHLHHFYTKRNYLIMNALWDSCEDYSERIRNAFRLLLLSYNASHSTLMTRVVAKQSSKDLVLTSAQSGVLYISNLPVEKNILKGIERKTASFAQAFRYVNKCTGHVEVRTASSTTMDLPTSSISYVFTDPPFGDFIPYAEVNQINELWLGTTTDRNEEAIISPSQGKDSAAYERLLEESFKRAREALVDNGTMTLVFHSSKADAWKALSSAIRGAGLVVSAASHLDRIQDSFKRVISKGGVKNDSILLLTKQCDSLTDVAPDLLSRFTASSDDPKKSYAEYVNFCLMNNIPVEYNAGSDFERNVMKAGKR